MGGLSHDDIEKCYFTPARLTLLANGWDIVISPGLFKIHEGFRKGDTFVSGDMESAASLCRQHRYDYDD